jgi:nicotinamidase-related amidase
MSGIGRKRSPAAGNLFGVTTSPWSRYALVLVDLQRDFWTEGVAATAPELPDRVAALLAYARAEGLTVVHVRARFRRDGSDWIARYRLRTWIPCIDGTPGVETLPFAAELAGEPVVAKQSFDGFLGTDLDEVLAERGVRGLLVAGLVTSTCVLFTASTGTQRGYLVKVVSDCCSDREELHHATLGAYPFVFDIVRSDQIAKRRDDWDTELERMATWLHDDHASESV